MLSSPSHKLFLHVKNILIIFYRMPDSTLQAKIDFKNRVDERRKSMTWAEWLKGLWKGIAALILYPEQTKILLNAAT